MSPSEQHLRADLKRLEDLALSMDDRQVAEQMLLVVGVVAAVHELHPVDARSRCLRCRPEGKRWLWRKRQLCKVRAIYDGYRLSMPTREPR